MNKQDVQAMINTGKFIALKEITKYRLSEAQLPLVMPVKHTDNSNGTINVAASWGNKYIIGMPTSLLPGFPVSSYNNRIPSKVWTHFTTAVVLYHVWQHMKRNKINDSLRTFDGSWVPRHQYHDLKLPLSIHTWGVGEDYDVRFNPPGAKANFINPQFIQTMQMHGYQWGGDWLSKDAMHFQYTDAVPGVIVKPWQDDLT